MATNIARLNVSIVGNGRGLRVDLQQNERALRRFGDTADRTSKRLIAFGRSFLAAAGFATAARGLFDLNRAGLEFNRTFTQAVRIQELSAESLERLRATSLQVSGEFLASAQELNAVIFDLGSAGFTLEEQIRGLRTVAQFAQAGGFADAQQAGTLLVNIQQSFGLFASELERVSDALVAGNQVGLGSLEQLSQGLQKVAPSARGLGVSLEQSVVFLNALIKSGLRGAEAGTGLERIFVRLSTAALKNADAFKAAGIAIFEDGQFRDGSDIVRDFEIALGDATAEVKLLRLANLGLDPELAATVLRVLGLSEAMEGWEEAMQNAGNASRDVAAKAISPLDKQIQQLKTSVTSVGVSFNTVITPALLEVAKNVEFLIGLLTRNEDTLARVLGPTPLANVPDQGIIRRFEEQRRLIDSAAATTPVSPFAEIGEQDFADFNKGIEEADRKFRQAGITFRESLRTPAEELVAEFDKIQRFKDLGVLNADEFSRALNGIADNFVEGQLRLQKQADDIIRRQRQSFVSGTEGGSIGDLANRISGLNEAIGQRQTAPPEDITRNILLQEVVNRLQALLDEAGDGDEINLTVITESAR